MNPTLREETGLDMGQGAQEDAGWSPGRVEGASLASLAARLVGCALIQKLLPRHG